MSANYQIKCVNSTDKSYFFGVYQTFPQSPGLRSVAWQVRGVPPKGQVSSTSDIDWSMLYGVSIADWDKDGKTYTGRQIVTAELGKAYEVQMTQDTIPTVNPNSIGSTSPGLINFKNSTSTVLDMGFTIGGGLVAVQSVAGGETIIFDVHPTYYVACFRNIRKGQLVDSGIVLTPVKVQYPHGYTKCEVVASNDGGTYGLKDPQYTSSYKAFAHPELDSATQASVVAVARVPKGKWTSIFTFRKINEQFELINYSIIYSMQAWMSVCHV